MHFIGTLFGHDSLLERSPGETQTAKNWKIWKETYPDAAERALPFRTAPKGS